MQDITFGAGLLAGIPVALAYLAWLIVLSYRLPGHLTGRVGQPGCTPRSHWRAAPAQSRSWAEQRPVVGTRGDPVPSPALFAVNRRAPDRRQRNCLREPAGASRTGPGASAAYSR
jgi:hypothetical protein